MLANPGPSTPRPKPPAKARRSLIRQKSSPPPPYVLTPECEQRSKSDTVPGSPAVVTTQILDYFGGDGAERITADCLNERSRDELHRLLARAEQTIKERGDELGLTSEVCRNLYQDNVTLKSEHDALFSRLPLSRSQSPDASFSPPASPAYHTQSLSPYSSSFSDIGSPISARLSFQSPRRITISADDIAFLTEQNQELLAKLEKLEEESAQADLAGKRKLRKLEKEIQGMRDELERTQSRSAELEERTRKLLDREVDIRKQERIDRYHELRAMTEPHPRATADFRDFSPGGAMSGPVVPRHAERLPSWPLNVDITRTEPLIAENYPIPQSTTPRGERQSEDERNMIAQLLEKIRELEDVNAQMTHQQADTSVRLLAAQRDSDNIKKLYDVFRDQSGADLEIIVEDADAQATPVDASISPAMSSRTGLELPRIIRFKSLRRSIEEMSLDLDAFAEGIQDDMRSTGRGLPVESGLYSRKPRKPIVGLFDEPEPSGSDRSSPDQPDLSFHSFGSSLPPSPIIPSLPAGSHTPRIATPTTPLSDSKTMSLMFGPGHIEPPCRVLSSELGAELQHDNVWGSQSENHHLRRTSLANISLFSEPCSPLDISSSLPGAFEHHDSQGNISLGEEMQAGLVEPLPSFASLSKEDTSAVGLAPPMRPDHSLRNRRLSEAMLSRSGRWKEARASHWATGGASPVKSPTLKHATKGSKLGLASIFEAAVDAMNMGPSGGSPVNEFTDLQYNAEEVADDADNSALEVRPAQGTLTENKEKMGLVQVVLELWLWLQFVIIIVVFLWAMAKRGPRSVLADAEKRRRTTSLTAQK
ncbi:hypothetical protein PUNSTDRAFT_125565 [Punctularia strigosozonata HHB-11173 SS5]|uniref:uncharacterized protein n=1 Tax=Punctularia strigosozonata (strain HHB-11173) TaxID=741275 RepID=UPI00044170E4|nr:uncharacterized protein PUNSTDRAFT_125565 [Punctularia strigosozonata HHB-11173 SS5]EIN10956.1 hypothetical protein PUNSTDRAFT_125565 [Punctularia strigosozonata HHB-11173 SS5]